MKNKIKSALKASFSDTHVHNFPQFLAEASATLKSETPVQEFIINLQELLKNGQLADKSFAFCPVKDDGRVKKIQDPTGLPTNMTLLSTYFKILSNKCWNPFVKQKVYKNNKKVKDQVQDPVIYFAFPFVTDEQPEELLTIVSHEWHNRSSNILKLKSSKRLKAKQSSASLMYLLPLHKRWYQMNSTIFYPRLKQWHRNMSQWSSFLIQMIFHPIVPCWQLNSAFKYQDALYFDKLTWKAQANRKVFQVECNSRYAKDIKKLAQIAKNSNLVKDVWGKHTYISKVVDKDSTPSKIRRLLCVAQLHTNYQCLMILGELVGITDLNMLAELYQPGVSTPLRFNLWLVLLCFVQIGNGHRLFAKVHQSNEVMGRVQAVIPNTPEDEQMVIMMNKNLPAYVGFSFRDQGLPELFLLELLKQSCCSTLVAEINSCMWDLDSGVLLLSANPTKISIWRIWKRRHGLRMLLRISNWYQKVAPSILPLRQRLYSI